MRLPLKFASGETEIGGAADRCWRNAVALRSSTLVHAGAGFAFTRSVVFFLQKDAVASGDVAARRAHLHVVKGAS